MERDEINASGISWFQLTCSASCEASSGIQSEGPPLPGRAAESAAPRRRRRRATGRPSSCQDLEGDRFRGARKRDGKVHLHCTLPHRMPSDKCLGSITMPQRGRGQNATGIPPPMDWGHGSDSSSKSGCHQLAEGADYTFIPSSCTSGIADMRADNSASRRCGGTSGSADATSPQRSAASLPAPNHAGTSAFIAVTETWAECWSSRRLPAELRWMIEST